MIQYSPSIVITRLVVRREKSIAYDETYHAGINVVRGENSSGKSTILNFLVFGLGGDLHDWSEHALLCTHVWLEVELNGNPVVLRRKIERSSKTGMDIFGGRYPDATQAPLDAWKHYPYRRTPNLESFSQALFRLLGMPEVATESSANITMHQLLRLLYSDQLSPVEEIFRAESFDSPNVREAIGHLLAGAFDNEVLGLQQKLRSVEKQHDDVSAELNSIVRIVHGADESTGVEWVEAARLNITKNRDALLSEIANAELVSYSQQDKDEITLDQQNLLYNNVQRLQIELNTLKNEAGAIEFEIADSDKFIASLKQKIADLQDASATSEIIGGVSFASCPACYAKLDHDVDVAACHLCKTPFDAEKMRDRAANLINESAIQLKQSEKIQEHRLSKQEELRKRIDVAESTWAAQARELQDLLAVPTTDARNKLRELHRQLGYIDRELEDIDEKRALAARIEALRDQKSLLYETIDRLKDRIDQLVSAQSERLISARKNIEKNTVALLKRDLKRQDSFENPKSVEFSFRKNNISVNGQDYVSASSRVILKNCFMLAFLQSALEDKTLRHPRFLIIDTTEDKGLEPDRSRNFQNIALDVSSSSKVNHQVIMATAMPSPEIDDDQYVGEFSTRENGTLQIKG